MLLDELMGRTRNVLPGKDAHEMEWWDSEVGGSHVRRLGLTRSLSAVYLSRCARAFCVDSALVTSSQILEQTLVCHKKLDTRWKCMGVITQCVWGQQ